MTIPSNTQRDYPLSLKILELTAQVVQSYITTNNVPLDEVPVAIERIHEAFSKLSTEALSPHKQSSRMISCSPEHSIQDDYLICLEDGKKLTMLKRYLKRNFNMTPEEYRLKWGLPSDYPMVAPNYADKRRDMARAMGLGKSTKKVSSKKIRFIKQDMGHFSGKLS